MRRSRIDIIVDILNAADGGGTKTSIVYGANLNFKLASSYLDLLQKHGLMEKKSDRYEVTPKGIIFREKAREITLNLEDQARTL